MSFKIFFLFSIIILHLGVIIAQDPPGLWDPIWTWKCTEYNGHTKLNSTCLRQSYNKSDTSVKRIPLKTCWLTCGEHGPLWPYPTEPTSLGNELTGFLPTNVKLVEVNTTSEVVQGMVEDATQIMIGHLIQTYNLGLQNSYPKESKSEASPRLINNNQMRIAVAVVNSTVHTIKLETDESYSLTVALLDTNTIQVTITGNTYFGVRHGLETLTQLIAFNDDEDLLQIVNAAQIRDKPTFRYRGLMMDTGRNFIPIENLKKMLDAMSYNKFNMFHWHLSDSNSIPFLSKRRPLVTKYGVFSPTKVYRPEEILDLIKYANLRGIKIIPELDAPSHAGNGWQWGPLEGLGELSLCINAQPYREYCIQPPCGQLNPLNNETLNVLGDLFRDFLEIFDNDIFHLGNDEISFDCWLKYQHITDWLKEQNTDIMDLWGMFQGKSLQKLKEANTGNPISAIVWTSEMTSLGRKFLDPKDYIIQIWSLSNDSSIGDILNEDYRVIFSNEDHLYLDHGYGGWRNFRNTPIKYWQQLYSYDILSLVESFVGKEKTDQLFADGKLFGGEAALWSEKVDAHNMEMKLWPRGAALAERLWSNPLGDSNTTSIAYPRLILHRERMIERGVNPDTLVPESCHHIWGFCDDIPDGQLLPEVTTVAPESPSTNPLNSGSNLMSPICLLIAIITFNYL